MTPRHVKRLLLFTLTAVLLGLSIQQGFGHAWQSQYTYAFAPAAKALPQAASQSAKPPVAAPVEPDVPDATPQALSKRVVEYNINVALQSDARSLYGEQTVTWTNPGKKTVSELYFHLYPNAFYSDKTTFMRESKGKLREDKATANSQGYMKLSSLETLEGESLLPRLHYVQPDDGNADDFTLAKLKLPVPVAPGKSVTLQMGFDVKLPEVFARMGYSGSFIMAGQWFPKLAVYETAGMRGRTTEGWNIHQYHGNSEFYSDFGIYTVKIQVPETYTVAATGFQTKAPSSTGNGEHVYQFYADDVHDFAWSASPDFVYVEDTLSGTGIPGVRIKLYLDPAHEAFKDRYMHAAKSALSKYAQWYGEYPYSTLSVVVPPKGANGAGGMEYPTLVTAFAADNDNPGYSLERTVVHEVGHQYWYGMVASNEFEEAWLDEGFTSYAEDKVMESVYGVVPNNALEASYLTDPAPLKQPSWAYNSHNHYAENVYMRGKLVLLGIENQAGSRTMQKIMRTYFQKYKFKHPTSSDFQRVVEQVTKEKWNDYFNQFVYNDLMADFSIESVQAKPVEQDGQKLYESVVVVKKNGGVNGPVSVLLQFKDGSSLPKEWNAEESNIQYKVVHTSPVIWAAVDPKNVNVLDNKHINNFMLAELPEQTRTRWGLSVAKIIEGLLGALSW
ncbi:M1 family metallopeptidase [Paenibacillus sp. NEAU-GSW1]|uniref:M1 family metallopeptidase n=1 Tax=Paenibacillus sp. NEAU-GSW1 TaxID=2682486 RepID=UPI0012E1DAB8|nr:M1 family metallopeptidase [Paenibacillus sp. NEAU-GSW1]MUT67909.1 M1 family peptidase [Paenibacillus sp. NEAU-GSW1]